jgi:hypothetical protein
MPATGEANAAYFCGTRPERRRLGGSGFYNENRSCFVLYTGVFSLETWSISLFAGGTPALRPTNNMRH